MVQPRACAHEALLLARGLRLPSPGVHTGMILFPLCSVLSVVDPALDVNAARGRLVLENPWRHQQMVESNASDGHECSS